jgi:hypothetical protein
MNIPAYSLSVWEEKYNSSSKRLEEKFIAEIGSDTMNYRGAANEVKLNKKVNGEITLSFKIYTQWIDEQNGQTIYNPFCKYLINDRTIKLKYRNEWYDFVITEIEETTEDYSNFYTCTNMAVYELSKNGYAIELSNDLYDNEGTATELAKKVVEGTDWTVIDEEERDDDIQPSDIIYETQKSPLYSIILNRDISAKNVLTGESISIKAGSTIYAFYVDIIDKISPLQILYGVNKVELDDTNVISNMINYEVKVSYEADIPTITDKLTLITTFEGYKYIDKDRYIYDDVSEKFVQLYKDKDGNPFYGRTDSYYSSSIIVANLTTMPFGFQYTDGVLTGWYANEASTISVESFHGKNYLSVQRNSSQPNLILNSGPYDNSAMMMDTNNIPCITKGDRYILRGIFAKPSATKDGKVTEIQEADLSKITAKVVDADYDAVNGTWEIGNNLLFNQVALSSGRQQKIKAGRFYPPAAEGESGSFKCFDNSAIDEETWLLDLKPVEDGVALQQGSIFYLYRYKNGHFFKTSESREVYWSTLDGHWSSEIALNAYDRLYVNRKTGVISMYNGENEYIKNTDGTSTIKYIWFEIEDFDSTSPIPYTYVEMEAIKDITYAELSETKYYIVLESSDSSTIDGNTYNTTYIGALFFSKKETYILDAVQAEKDTSKPAQLELPIFVGSIPLAQLKTKKVYYSPLDKDGNKITKIENLQTIPEDEASKLTAVRTNFLKIRSVEASKSNRFNILQSICEKFEIWIKFYIKHNPNGTVCYDDDGNPCKYISFHKYVGKLNYSGFIYGINLNSIQRTINSDDIVSKLIVEDNSNEGADSGYCSIQKATANKSHEKFIYNFDYYINKGLLPNDFKKDLYGVDGYYQALKKINEPLLSLTNASSIAQVDEIKLGAKKETYQEYASSILVELQQNRQNLVSLLKNITLTATPENDFYVSEALCGRYYDENGKLSTGQIDNKLQSVVSTIKDLVAQYNAADRQAKGYTSEYDAVVEQIKSYKNDLKAMEESKDLLNADFYKKYNRFIREGTWTSDDYIDDNLYYLDALTVSETNAQPKVEYSISVADVSAIEGLEPFTFDVGDKTTIEDSEFFGPGIKEEVVVSEVEWNLNDPSSNTITVQNYKTQFESLFSRIEASVAQVEYSTGKYNKASAIVNPDGTIDPATASASLNGANNTAIQNTASLITIANDGITSKSQSQRGRILKLTNGQILTSTDGGATYSPTITPTGINTNLLTSGRINANKIQIMSDDTATFIWNSTGLNAYSTTGKNVDYAKFVRYDQFGLYGVDGNATSDGHMYSYNFEPTSVGEIKTNKNILFGLTWDGFFLRGKNSNVNIDSETGISMNRDNGTIILGKYYQNGKETYGLSIEALNKDGTTNNYLRASSEGINIGSEVTVGDNNKTLLEMTRQVNVSYGISADTETEPSSWGIDSVHTTPTKAQPYLWQKVSSTDIDGNVNESVTCITSGVMGTDGVGIKSTEIGYYYDTQGGTPPTPISWQSTPAAAQTAQSITNIEGLYLWNKILYIYTDNSITHPHTDETYTVSYQGRSGDKGAGVTNIQSTYQYSKDGSTKPTGNWYESIADAKTNQNITNVQGYYLWIKWTSYSGSKVINETYQCSYNGTSGIDGDNPYTISITGNTSIKNGKGTIVLTPHIFQKGFELKNVPAGLKLCWYKNKQLSSTAVSGTSTSEATYSQSNFLNSAEVTCQLETI